MTTKKELQEEAYKKYQDKVSEANKVYDAKTAAKRDEFEAVRAPAYAEFEAATCAASAEYGARINEINSMPATAEDPPPEKFIRNALRHAICECERTGAKEFEVLTPLRFLLAEYGGRD